MTMTTSVKLQIVGSICAVLTLLGGALFYVNDRYSALLEQQQLVANTKEKLNEQRLKFEQQKATLKIELYNREQQLNKKQEALAAKEALLMSKQTSYEVEVEKKIQNKLTALTKELEDQRKVSETRSKEASQEKAKLKILQEAYAAKLSKVEALYEKYSNQAVLANSQAKAEQEIYLLMRKFSDLGVKLSHKDWCDKEYTKRYYQAEGILSQISSIASANNIFDNYRGYLISNSAGFSSSKDGVCEP